ncbi:MAG: hypothetical protein N2322_07115 [Terrimicrobiaceae bacterium]|nr:hypothetical protein [Terrimicrobiaceae bacterium]
MVAEVESALLDQLPDVKPGIPRPSSQFRPILHARHQPVLTPFHPPARVMKGDLSARVSHLPRLNVTLVERLSDHLEHMPSRSSHHGLPANMPLGARARPTGRGSYENIHSKEI